MMVHGARAVALCVAALALAAPSAADWKPTKPVEIIVHTGPGGGSDVLARAVAVMMEKEKLVPVRMQVINKPGGNGAVAAAALAEKKDDPHTIGLFTSVWIAGPLTSSEAKITIHDLKPIAGLLLEPAVFAVRADSPYKSLKEFVDAAKAHPGALKQSGGSVTSRDNIVRLSLQHATGAKWAFVSFQGGGERLAALLGGHVDTDAPTLKEAGFDVVSTPQIRGVVAPPQQSAEASAYWEGRFDALRKTESWKKYIHDNQLEEDFLPGAQLKNAIAEIERRLREQYQLAGIKTVR